MRYVRIALASWLLVVGTLFAGTAELEKIGIGFISVEKTPLEDFFRMLSAKYNQNFVVEDASIRTLTVDVRLRDVSLKTLVDAVCRTHGLAYSDRGTHIGITGIRNYYENANFIKSERNFVSKRLRFTPANAVIELLANLMPGKVVVNEAKEHRLYQTLYDASPDLSIPGNMAESAANILPGESGSQSTASL